MSTPSRLVDNSYYLHELLGEGGMAVVYRATYRLTGESVALKVVSSAHLESADDTTSDGFRLRLALLREFQALASLHHPNIVEVMGYGVDEGRDPYFTMEILQKPADIVKAAEGQPLSAKIDLLAQLLRALTYVHRRGLLHRDIKPSNVLCVNGQVKVLDFGIAVAATKADGIAGTLDYMAPEILTGNPPSVASDLYAVGILASQMITGQFPHNRKSQTAFLAGVFNTNSDITLSGDIADLLSSYPTTQDGDDSLESLAPVGPAVQSEVGPVSEVINKLLSVDPLDRYPDAPAVMQALAAATGEAISVETAATRESFLQASEMVGREGELAQLTKALDGALAKAGSGWLLGGESGVGKSRLLMEVRTLAMVSGAIVSQGQAVTEGGSLYQLWIPVLRILCLHVELSDEDAAILKELIPDLPTLLGREIPVAPKVQPEFAEKRLFAVIESLFRKPSRPLIVLLEDLQWAGPDSLALLSRLSEIARERSLMLLATYRDDEYPDLPQRLPQMKLLRLQRLSQDAVAQLSTSMLGELGKQPWVVDYLCRQTEGNVFFLVEVARAIAEQAGELDAMAATALPEHIFTLGIGRIVERRLDHVPAHYRPVLEAAATIGRKLDQAVLQILFPELDLRTFLMVCANSAILESSEGDWRFVHDKLREGLLERLALPQRQKLHGEVARAVEAIYGTRESHYAVLGYHFKLAGNPDKASQYYLRAGETATRLCAYNDARKHLAGALDALKELAENDEIKRLKVDTLLKLVKAAHIADQPKQNLERLDEASQLLKSVVPGSEAENDEMRLAWVNYWRGRLHYYCDDSRESLRYHQQVLATAKEHGHTELITLVSSASGTALFSQGRVDLGLPLLAGTIETYAAMGHGYEWVRAVGHQGLCLIGLGQYERGITELNRAHARALEIDKPIIISMTHLYYSMGSPHSGDWPVMLARGHKCLDYARQCGEKIYQALGLGYIAWAENQLGRPEEALKHYRTAQETVEEMGGQLLFSRPFEAAYADILFNSGKFTESIERAQAVIESSRLADNCHAWGNAERVWGMALHRLDPAASDEVDRHMSASIQAFATGWLVLDIARTRLAWAGVCRDRGDLTQGRKLLDEAILQFMSSGCTYALECAQQVARTWNLPTLHRDSSAGA